MCLHFFFQVATIIGFIINYADQAGQANERNRAEAEGGGHGEEGGEGERRKGDYGLPSWLVGRKPLSGKHKGDKRRTGRSIPDSDFTLSFIEKAGNAMFSALTSLDSLGCLNKLMCQFNSKKSSDLTPQEYVMVHLFSGKIPESYSKENCDETYSQCPFEAKTLNTLFSGSWSLLDWSFS